MDSELQSGSGGVRQSDNIERESTRGTTEDDVSRVSYTEVFERQLPYYMAIGMSMGEYWDGPAELARYYRKAHEIRSELQNEQNWLLGMYFACGAANAIHGKKAPYPEEPFPLNTEIGRKRRERQQELNELKVTDYLNTWANNTNQKFFEKQRLELEKQKKKDKEQDRSEDKTAPE